MPADVSVYGGDGQLDVPDVLPGQVARRAEHQLGDVGRLAHQAADRTVDLREVREVPELVESGQVGRGTRDRAIRMPPRELEHGRDGGGTYQVKVKFCLGQPVDERLDGLHRLDASNRPGRPGKYLTQECKE